MLHYKLVLPDVSRKGRSHVETFLDDLIGQFQDLWLEAGMNPYNLYGVNPSTLKDEFHLFVVVLSAIRDDYKVAWGSPTYLPIPEELDDK
jgi:hypothetical protein